MSTQHFRLATVLRVRRAQEEMARAALARRNRRVADATEERDRSARNYRAVPVSSGVVPAGAFLRESAAAGLAAATLTDASARLTAAHSDAEVALDGWREAARRVEALERLEQSRAEEYRTDELRREFALVDELVTSRYVGSSSHGDAP